MRSTIAFVWIAFVFVILFEVAQQHLEGKQLEGSKYEHIRYGNFKPFVRHMLNISQVLASFHVTDYIDCAFECLTNVACFSLNVALVTDNSSKLNAQVCHLLSTDKYTHANSFVPSDEFIHYAIPTPCESFPCQNGGSCLPLYGKNSYVCNCLKGNDGTHCEKVCQGALGMESREITDRQITASSEYDANHAAHQGRLHFRETSKKAGSWSVNQKNLNPSQWLQVDLNQLTKVAGVATQGRNNTNIWQGDHSQWVTRYKLQFSEDGLTFQYYREKGQISEKEFAGNEDRDTIVYHELDPPIRAHYIRFRPTAWEQWISMRAELYGCQVWFKINTDPVCYGTRNDSYGTFRIQKPGEVFAFKLVHLSGYVACSHRQDDASKWGCGTLLNTHITDANNFRLFPTNTSTSFNEALSYSSGFIYNSTELVLTFLSSPLSVSTGQEFRVWYGEDLLDKTEENNLGQNRIDVYGLY